MPRPAESAHRTGAIRRVAFVAFAGLVLAITFVVLAGRMSATPSDGGGSNCSFPGEPVSPFDMARTEVVRADRCEVEPEASPNSHAGSPVAHFPR